MIYCLRQKGNDNRILNVKVKRLPRYAIRIRLYKINTTKLKTNRTAMVLFIRPIRITRFLSNNQVAQKVIPFTSLDVCFI